MSTFRSFAKLNLHLEVVRRRPDGFHDLRTLFQTIDLADTIELESTVSPARRIELEVLGAVLPTDESNLAVRAARIFLDAWERGGRGVRIRLHKRIPIGGGLGGGSANAATVLLGLSTLCERPVDPEWLASAAREIGADVPFFLLGGTALGLGRGDELVALEDPDSGSEEIWLAIPPWRTATRDVFSALAAPPENSAPDPRIEAARLGRRARTVADWIGRNDLEEPAFRIRPEQGALYTALTRSGARKVRMSGSGSTLFALFDDRETARGAAAELPSGTVWQRVSTLGRAAWQRASGFETVAGGR